MRIFVMPAWISGIPIREDGSGDIHVSPDSGTPCWNDAIEGLLELTKAPSTRILKAGPFAVRR